MTQHEAIELIRDGIPKESIPASWIDLGSGTGTFTKALAQLLSDGSSILAIDKENHKILSPDKGVTISSVAADFTQTSLPDQLDGILIANALHYVKDQSAFLKKLFSHVKPSGRLIVIEYDTDQPNPWVPYPITFEKLKDLLTKAGFFHIQKIRETNSIYNSSKMYSCVADTTES